ncbi:cell cycle control [Fusarium beomiforme]|uniref:Cell cycle control n=1 Tax=Fusarium beomiforme TaxID=44412 RepID=A0A9P5A6D2_9HYPO|nr:cell cycle control [Fusarium beomiforme]
MAENSDDLLEMLEVEGDDDIVEVLENSTRTPPYAEDQLFLPNPNAPTAFPPSRNTRSERRIRGTRPSVAHQQPQEPAAVIDLTEEPDSPVQSRARLDFLESARPPARNPRRTNSQRISPPQLARTDGTFVGRSASVIDLTADSPEDERSHFARRTGRAVPRADELIELEIISQRPALGSLPNFAAFGSFSRRLAGIFGAADIGFNAPNLDISRHAFAMQAPPKPQMSPPPPTREGFTRDTCTDPEKESESVVICPACSEELAYDPSGTVTQSSVSTQKGKRKRSPGEHHFWAVKKCGHVYCADCYENRKPTKLNPNGVGFRPPDQRSAYGASNDLRCAVEDCDSKVSAKTEWVGIFL